MTPTLLICASLLIVAGVILLVCACIAMPEVNRDE